MSLTTTAAVPTFFFALLCYAAVLLLLLLFFARACPTRLHVFSMPRCSCANFFPFRETRFRPRRPALLWFFAEKIDERLINTIQGTRGWFSWKDIGRTRDFMEMKGPRDVLWIISRTMATRFFLEEILHILTCVGRVVNCENYLCIF